MYQIRYCAYSHMWEVYRKYGHHENCIGFYATKQEAMKIRNLYMCDEIRDRYIDDGYDR